MSEYEPEGGYEADEYAGYEEPTDFAEGEAELYDDESYDDYERAPTLVEHEAERREAEERSLSEELAEHGPEIRQRRAEEAERAEDERRVQTASLIIDECERMGLAISMSELEQIYEQLHGEVNAVAGQLREQGYSDDQIIELFSMGDEGPERPDELGVADRHLNARGGAADMRLRELLDEVKTRRVHEHALKRV